MKNFVQRPILIDKLIEMENTSPTTQLQPGKWYIAKPVQYSDIITILSRFYHSWLVITGKAHAYEYAIDRFNKMELKG